MESFRFYLISDRHQSRREPMELLPELGRAGLRALQVREKDMAPGELGDYCQSVRAALAMGGGDAKIFLNDRADIALGLGLAGVHLRESSLPLAQQAPILREALLWGVSTHDLAGVQTAQAAGADFVTFGPVFETASKAALGDPVGLENLARVAGSVRIPVLALGGITPERCGPCLEAGASGVAAIGAVWCAPDPVAALMEFKAALGGL